MNNTRQMLVALALGALGILGLAVAVRGQAMNPVAARQWYENAVKKITDQSTADEIVALAKQCYRNGLTDEAMAHAIEALRKDPNDSRAKYLLFALAGPVEGTTGTGEGDDGGGGTPQAPTITDAEADAIYKAEGDTVIRNFREIQGLLARRCGSVKCHGGNEKAKWTLALKGGANRKSLAQNFKTVYPYMDRDNPAKSVLVQKPLKGPEGGHPTQVIRGESDPVYQRIIKYIDTVKGDAEKMWDQ
ncbi:MAG TPA: hypothetical protein VM431_10695 [Phycisphaerae bacterium]|nr:hypothetical protein [Phycisphaerae bacterium]